MSCIFLVEYPILSAISSWLLHSSSIKLTTSCSSLLSLALASANSMISLSPQFQNTFNRFLSIQFLILPLISFQKVSFLFLLYFDCVCQAYPAGSAFKFSPSTDFINNSVYLTSSNSCCDLVLCSYS